MGTHPIFESDFDCLQIEICSVSPPDPLSTKSDAPLPSRSQKVLWHFHSHHHLNNISIMTSPSSKSMFQLKLVPLVFFQSTFQPSDASLQVTTVRIQRPNPPFLGVMNVYTAEGTQSF